MESDREGQSLNIFSNKDITKNEETLELYLKSNNEISSEMKNNIGWCYQYGIDINKDEKKAFEWYLKAAKEDNLHGCNNLGWCFENGIGINEDKDQAYEWYIKSAKGGNFSGQNNLGRCYENGIGIDIDKNKAFKWFLKSANGGNSSGQFNIGLFYRNCKGPYQNMEEATNFLRKARSNQYQNIDYEKLDIDLVKFLKNSMSENKYQLFWIPSNELKNIKKIAATGAFSTLYSAEWTYLHKYGARSKMVNLKRFHTPENYKIFMKELKTYYMIGSKDPTCYQCYGISKHEETGDYCLILQHMPLGPLNQNIPSIARMKWIEKVNLLFYIAYDLQLIHSLDIIHCNLNDGTILQYDINNAYINSFSLSLTVQEASIAKSELIGNLFHLAPEVFDENTFNKASDIYSFGILMWQISSERSISSEYGGATTIYSHILKLIDGIRPSIREGTISCYSDLMKRCWDSDPTKRPSASKIFRIFAKWKNDIAAFYESDPVNYNEDTENDLISIPVPLVNSTEPYEEELANELFENEIKKKSIKFIPWSELNDISKLDEGHFGFIFKAYWTKTHNNVICKALINLKDISGKYYTAFIHELTMHTRTDLCENIVRFLGASKDTINDRYFLIMEYANDGNLRSFLKRKNNSLNWHQRLELACQITKGLCYLHSEEIIHRDLHDKNIVIQNGKAKITDFGNATSINTQTNIHNGLFGMISFLAPELLKPTKSNNVPYCKKTDIYSLGMIFWELSSGHPPFDDQPNYIILSINIIQGIREDIIPGTPEEYINLYNKCWDADPYERPDIEYVHKLLEGITKIWSNVSYITNDPEDNTSPQTSSEQSRLTIEINDSKLLSLSVNYESETNYIILND